MMDKSRQKFEEAIKNGFNTKHLSLEPQREGGCGTYRWGETERCWEIWQASRDSLLLALPEREKSTGNYDYFTDGYNSGISACETVLLDNGVKIKNE